MIGRLRRRAIPPAQPEDPQRAEFFAAAREHTGHVSVVVDGVTYLVETSDDGVGADLFVRRLRPELVVLRRALEASKDARRGRTSFVDVGANLGTTILPALRAGFTDGVAVEPGPETARLLRANCALNAPDGAVRVIEAAASNEPGEALLDVSRSPGAFNLAGGYGRPVKATLAVKVVTLDGLVEEGAIAPERVGMLWLDVQGNEAAVLSASGRLLAAAPPLVLATRRFKLEAREELDRLLALLRPQYARLTDLRVPHLRAPGWKPKWRPLAELSEVVAERGTTDVLVL